MASNIKGITIEIGADVQPLNKALEGVNKNSKNIQAELKQVERLLKLDPTNVTLLAQKQDLLTKAIDNTSDKLNTLKEAEKQVQAQFEKGEVSEEQYRALQREVISTEQNLRGLETQLSDVRSETDKMSNATDGASRDLHTFSSAVSDAGKDVDKLGDQADNAGNKALSFGDVLSANMVSDIAIDLVKELASAMAELSRQLDSASGQIQASLGLTAKEAEELTEVARDVWTDGFGEDITDVTDNLAIVRQNLGDMSDVELQNILEKAYIVKDVFGADIPESIRAVKTIMQNFGLTAEEAFDLITIGYQNGLNFSDEFIDTINEYSVQFSDMGLSAEDAFALLKQGVDNGALSLDKVADSMKEFNIRIKDGSDTTIEGLSLLGINADEVTRKLADGSMTSADAMQLVIGKLAETDDKVTQNKAGVDLFGTQWEDTGADVILSLGGIEEGLGKVTGATEKAGDAASDNIDNKFNQSIRRLEDNLEPVSTGLMQLASYIMDQFSEDMEMGRLRIDQLQEAFGNLKEGAGELRSNIETKFEDIRKSISDKMEDAKRTVSNAAKILKGLFNFEWSLPKIKLPHFDIKGKFSLYPPSTPKFDVNWYKTGAIFNSPSVIGVGEAGSEAVLPIEKIDGIIASALEKAGGSGGGSVIVQNMYVRNKNDVDLVAQELYRLQQQNSRGRGIK
nr:phage tail tape measure protein [uncultured Aminipila sp.]